MAGIESPTDTEIDEVIGSWRQGDCVVGDHYVLFRLNCDAPITEDAVSAAKQQSDAAESSVPGFMVTSQTCDIVRSFRARPWVEVCALSSMDPNAIDDVKKNRQPRFAFVEGISQEGLVADLDRTMTVEKTVLAGWKRIAGCSTDADKRNLALALARKRQRFAFPDDFVRLASKLSDRIKKKHDKAKAGIELRELREIRVSASPDWNAPAVEITIYFIQSESSTANILQHLDGWLDLIPSKGRFEVDGQITTLKNLLAIDYLESDPLDLDHLSRNSK